MSVEVCYTSCASNPVPTIAHWGKNDLICYGSCNSVRIYDPSWGSGGKVTQTLYGHTKRVTSVRWICGVDYEIELVSGSSDGTAIVWTLKDKTYVPFILKGHDGNINIVDGLYRGIEKKITVVATASIDSTVKIWIRQGTNDAFSLSQSLDFGYSICVGLKMSSLPLTNAVILACGMDNSNIKLYVQNMAIEDKDLELVHSETLKGHENWVRGLDFTVDGDNLFLASTSQDAFIRLWKIAPAKQTEGSAGDHTSTIAEMLKRELIVKKLRLKVGDVAYIISLESILAGHEAWVYSVSWNPKDFTLLSASLDKSMIIWEYNTDCGLWLEKVRVGEVGGNTLGFYGGMFGRNGLSILANGYHGAFHIWNFSEETNIWEPAVTISGHFNEVIDLAWEPQGEFLITVSSDQTTRIHAPWSLGDHHETWHEIARPQVHGYDMTCLAVLSRYRFASGGDEKVIRTFEAPRNFVENFRRICKITQDPEGDNVEKGMEINPKGAAVPSLGLSNKAVYEDDNKELATATDKKNPYPEESYFTAMELTEPPTEETLLQNTLWPEIQKLYGHGYEVYALTANCEGTLLASACKATTVEHSAILLWDTSTWTQIQKLISHSLTVAQLAFSPDSKHLLSVSRDRRWTVFTHNPETNSFEVAATTDKKTGIHTRIIWSCAWSHDSKYFATGSRDGKVVIWTKNSHKVVNSVLGQYDAAGKYLEFKGEPITAVAFAPVTISNNYLIAIGLESGIIRLYKWIINEWTLFSIIEKEYAHHLTVKRLAFRPVLGVTGDRYKDNNEILQLASCGSDFTVRVYNIDCS